MLSGRLTEMIQLTIIHTANQTKERFTICLSIILRIVVNQHQVRRVLTKI